jgi:hypothetical protein
MSNAEVKQGLRKTRKTGMKIRREKKTKKTHQKQFIAKRFVGSGPPFLGDGQVFLGTLLLFTATPGCHLHQRGMMTTITISGAGVCCLEMKHDGVWFLGGIDRRSSRLLLCITSIVFFFLLTKHYFVYT